MKVQMTGSYPCITGVAPTPTAAGLLAMSPAEVMAMVARTPAARVLPAMPAALTPPGFSPLPRGSKVHVFSPAVACQTPLKEKVLDGLRAFSDLITPHCGQKVAIGASAIWLAVDGVSAVHTIRDSGSSLEEKASAGAAVGVDVLGLCSGLLGGAPGLDQAASVVNFAAVIGDQVHTGQITLSPSDLAQFSSDPQSDDVSNILKLTEIFESPAGS